MVSEMSLPKPTAILFDWDNTLVDTWPMIHRALNMTLNYMEHPEWSFEKVKSNVTKSMRDSFPELFAERWEEAADHYQKSYRSIHLDTIAPLAGAEDMLKAASAVAKLGLVSNKKGPSLRLESAHLGWDSYFGIAVGAQDAARDKPAPEPALMALKALGVEPSPRVWFVGDTVVDLECANAIGAVPILYGDHALEGNLFEGAAFSAQVKSHAELTALIQSAI